MSGFDRWLGANPGFAAFFSTLWPGEAVAGAVFFHTDEGVTVGAITVKDTDPDFTGTVSFVDAKGDPTSPDAGMVPNWSVDNTDAVTVTAAGDGMSATFTPGNPGAAVVTVTLQDADGTTVTSTGTITVEPGEAVLGDVEFSPGAAAAPAPTDTTAAGDQTAATPPPADTGTGTADQEATAPADTTGGDATTTPVQGVTDATQAAPAPDQTDQPNTGADATAVGP